MNRTVLALMLLLASLTCLGQEVKRSEVLLEEWEFRQTTTLRLKAVGKNMYSSRLGHLRTF